jgi:hypothetical protein
MLEAHDWTDDVDVDDDALILVWDILNGIEYYGVFLFLTDR